MTEFLIHCEEKQQDGPRKQILQVADVTRQQPKIFVAPVPALDGIPGWKLEVIQPNLSLREHIPPAAGAGDAHGGQAEPSKTRQLLTHCTHKGRDLVTLAWV